MQTTKLLFIGLSLSLSSQALAVNLQEQAQPVKPPLPKTMVSMGDSITAGAVAGLSRSGFYNPFHLLKLLSTLGEMAFKWSAYDAIQDRHLSWATGLSSDFSVKSHAQRLAYLHNQAGTNMNVTSVSWSGDTSFNLAAQVDHALEWSEKKTGTTGPEYVTLLIGANDICANSIEGMVDDRDFYNNVDTAVSRIVSANPNAKIMISSLPDVNSLATVAKRSKLLGFNPINRCEDFWRKTNLCATITRRPAGGYEEYAVGQKVLGLNRMLSEVADRINVQTGQRSVAFAASTYEKKFTDDDISIDCFHPNQRGQNILAKATWDDGFWSEGWNDEAYDKYVKKIKQARNRKVGPPHR